ncbi:iron-containing alcohol dehydrogenase [Saccharopolyspora sp. K220]|uniref:iron-containing alcohol dehydrogenase n=1 Tax=Saccharopolyspora soli TaxID=2926618 RepID=UPI001F5A2EAD|nr:iron-containing alcohol dehydrogenase [Saccharopolyspora soli]MCI2423198.1 iron-containing alcohol dehydrogenase [Saccharopolyspora soli]
MTLPTTTPDAFGLIRAPRQIVFGPGQRSGLGDIVATLGTRALVCTDARMAEQPQFREMLANLRAAGVAAQVFAGVAAELPADTIVGCVAEVSGQNIDVVVGIGGGSCIDHAKVVSALLVHGGAPRDYYGEFKVPGPALPVVAVPTTAGTGSEVTPVAVIADPDREMKVGISSPHLIPHTALVDPALTYTCPRPLTAHAAADALSHCVEAFTAIRREPDPGLTTERVFVGKSLLTDSYALAGIELIDRSIVAACQGGDDRAARHDLQLGALYGGFALGTAGTAAAHALQYPIGAATHTPHGAGVGALLPYVMAYNMPARTAEFATIASALHCADGASELDRAHAAVHRVAELLGTVGIPRDLAELGLREDRVDWAAEQGMTAARLVDNNPRPLDPAELGRIVRAAFDGDLAGLLATTSPSETDARNS